MTNYANPQTLISTVELAARLDDARHVIVEVDEDTPTTTARGRSTAAWSAFPSSSADRRRLGGPLVDVHHDLATDPALHEQVHRAGQIPPGRLRGDPRAEP